MKGKLIMNKVRRKSLEKAIEFLAQGKEIVEDAWYQEDEYLANIPDNLRNSERAYTSEEAVAQLEEIGEVIDQAIDSIYEIVGI